MNYTVHILMHVLDVQYVAVMDPTPICTYCDFTDKFALVYT